MNQGNNGVNMSTSDNTNIGYIKESGDTFDTPKKVTPINSASGLVCPKCGFGLAPEATICMHCGKKVEEITGAAEETSVVYENARKKGIKGIIFTNLLLFAIAISAYFIFEIPSEITIKDITISLDFLTPIVAIGIICVTTFYTMCTQILLQKANIIWWGLFVPIYNCFILYRLMTGEDEYFLLNLIGVEACYFYYLTRIDYLIYGAIAYEVLINIIALGFYGKRFSGKSFIMMFLFPIYIPLLALNPNKEYMG